MLAVVIFAATIRLFTLSEPTDPSKMKSEGLNDNHKLCCSVGQIAKAKEK